jgi:uncharacterized membrane protein YjjP (DUF1212 family)
MTATGVRQGVSADVDRLLTRFTRFLLLYSAEGGFELRETVRSVGAAYQADADVLAVAEGAVLVVRHPDGSEHADTVHVAPELARLDLVAEGKFLAGRISAGGLTAADADRELAGLAARRESYPAWLRIIGVTLFAAGFAPSVQATWRELGSSVILGAVMGVLFVVADRLRVLRTLLPIVGPLVVAVIAFEALHADRAPGGPVILMIPALFVLIPGDFLCAATVELAVGQITPGAVRLAQAAFTLVELAAGVVIAAEITGAGTRSLFEARVPSALPGWVLVVSWIPFTIGLAWTFSARMRDVPWILGLVYIAWGVQQGMTRAVGPTAGTFAAAAALAVVAGLLERSARRPPRIVLILGGFFALTVGALALRGLTTIDAGNQAQGLADLRDAITQTAALTLGLIVGAIAAMAGARNRT